MDTQRNLRDELSVLLTQLTDEHDSIIEQLQQLENRRSRLVEEIRGLRLLVEDLPETSTESSRPKKSEVDPMYRGLTVREALHKMARARNGRVIITKAMDELVKAGFYRDRKHARNSVYPELKRLASKGEFFKVDPGVFKQARDPFEAASHSDAQSAGAASQNGVTALKIAPWIDDYL